MIYEDFECRDGRSGAAPMVCEGFEYRDGRSGAAPMICEFPSTEMGAAEQHP